MTLMTMDGITDLTSVKGLWDVREDGTILQIHNGPVYTIKDDGRDWFTLDGYNLASVFGSLDNAERFAVTYYEKLIIERVKKQQRLQEEIDALTRGLEKLK